MSPISIFLPEALEGGAIIDGGGAGSNYPMLHGFCLP